MADESRSLGEHCIQSLSHIHLLWWLVADVMGGISTAVLWGFSHPFWAGVAVSATGISTFITFLAKAKYDGELSIQKLGNIVPEAAQQRVVKEIGPRSDPLFDRKVDELRAEWSQVKSKLIERSPESAQPPQLITFGIDENKSKVHVSEGKTGYFIATFVRLKVFKEGDKRIGIKEVHASLHKKDGHIIETIFPKESFSSFTTELLKENWMVTEPITFYVFCFDFIVPKDQAKDLSSLFLRVNMSFVGQSSQSVDFYVRNWDRARTKGRKGGSTVILRR